MADGSAPFSVNPTAGTLVIMRSDIPHEVLPAYARRVALTVWMDGVLMKRHPLYEPPEGRLAAAADAPRAAEKRGWRRLWPFDR